uniref:G-protein coupled receptors family 3 profile domain-containing protein n=1 Tax=Castor canadensis TaxID=51338 RepID=A0A8C0WJ97_CASCN
MQISGVSLALTWPHRLCLLRVLLCVTATATSFPLSKRTRGGDTAPAFSGQHGYLQFTWEVGLLPSSVEFSSHRHFYKLSCFWLLGMCRTPAFSSLACLFTILGGFPFSRLQYSGHPNYQFVLVLYFTIEEINRDSHLLPNISLGFNKYSKYFFLSHYLHQMLVMVDGYTLQVTSYKDETNAIILTNPNLKLIPSLFLTSPDEKNMWLSHILDQFPSLYQMAPKDSFLAHAMISLLLHFGWTWVALFVSDDMKGEQFLWDLKAEMIKNGICMAFTEKLSAPKTMYGSSDITFMSRIRVSSANVHILYGETDSLITMDVAAEFFLTTGKVWIMTRKWDIVVYEMNHMLHSFHGSFSFSHHKGEIPGFRHFLKRVNPSQYPGDFYFSKLWLHAFQCSPVGSLCGKIGVCPPNSSLEFMPGNIDIMTISDSSYFIYNAVYAIAHVLHQMLLEKIEMGSSGHTDKPRMLPWEVNKETNYMAHYDIENTVNFPAGLGLMVKVGEIFSKTPHDQVLIINDKIIEWPIGFTENSQSVCSQSCLPGFRKIPQEGRPICCFTCGFCPERHISNQTDADHCFQCSIYEYPNSERTHCIPKVVIFLAFEDSLGMTLACIALCFSVITVVVLVFFMKHKDTPIVKANNRNLSYILLISLFFTCILQQITFGLVFTVAVSTVLAKTITVILSFKIMKPGRTMRWLLVSGAVNSVIPICTLIQLIFCGIWLATSPPFIDTDAHSEHGHIIILCNKGSLTAFYCVLGYLGSLALASFTVAFLARNLPDTFNEAKFLTFSMLVFCSVWVTFLPVYHSTKGKVMVAVEVFSILTSSAGLLCCIFVPKCYIIIMRPDKNCLKNFKNRKCSRGKKTF